MIVHDLDGAGDPAQGRPDSSSAVAEASEAAG